MLPILIGGGLGLAKYALDKGREGRQRKLQAETTRFSPWTGMQAEAPQEANVLGSVMQGATAGAMFGQQNPLEAVKNAASEASIGTLGVQGTATSGIGDELLQKQLQKARGNSWGFNPALPS